VTTEGDTPLLYVLRNDLGLNGPKFGCGLQQCGSCAAIVGGQATRTCLFPLSAVGKAQVVTLEGLGTVEKPHPLQKAFIDEQAAQCGYCINGMIMTAKAFLDRNPHPTRAEICQALARNLCRCGTHLRIIRAIESVAKGPGI
jgi:nicotinate dehydrogenase subunit A